jgi:hypothetical protein
MVVMDRGDSERGKRWIVNLPDEQLADVVELINFYGEKEFAGMVRGLMLARQLWVVPDVDED